LKLISVTVQNFRSITTARRIPISELTTLVGPNNEGKSNILRALVIATNSLIAKRSPFRLTGGRRRRRVENRYDWATDCPLKLQRKPNSGSMITLEFDLSTAEIDEFHSSVGSKMALYPSPSRLVRKKKRLQYQNKGPDKKHLIAKQTR
jgi:putative ATP-dependent endonuclease of the OLD family